MKRVILMVAALVMVVSGVAAVSAYEAHLINVTAHVENALKVDTTPIDFGTVFPEEWLGDKLTVELSDSAVTELGQGVVGDLESVDLEVYAEWKPNVGMNFAWDDGGTWVADTGYYNWMGYFTYVGWNSDGLAANMNLIGGPPAGNPGTAAKQILGGPYTLTGAGQNFVYVSIDVPDFEGYWNDLTDVNPKPSGLEAPTYVVPADMPGFDQDGMDFGLDLKIQVVGINRVIQIQ